MKRVIIFKNGTDVDGKAVPVPRSIDELLSIAAKKFDMTAKRIFTAEGGELDDVELIRDNDVLYVSEGEAFKKIVDLSEKEQPSRGFRPLSEGWITLNVGGKRFVTSRSTLIMKEPNSMLAKMFAETSGCFVPSEKDETGAYLIDRSPFYFKAILNYLRTGEVILDDECNPRGILEEAKYYGLERMIPEVEHIINFGSRSKNTSPLSRREVMNALMSTTYNSQLRFQGVNLEGADLSRLDLRFINLKCASLRGCRLVGTNLSHCILERADLSHAILDGALLQGVKMLCANLEGASLKECTFEDPAGTNANMEGVNMKGANLEGSNMAGVHLRVANLKNANMKHCDLRAAVLAGADLENCDLTGSNLQETNLRGANLKGASLELMQAPLHMSQTVAN